MKEGRGAKGKNGHGDGSDSDGVSQSALRVTKGRVAARQQPQRFVQSVRVEGGGLRDEGLGGSRVVVRSRGGGCSAELFHAPWCDGFKKWKVFRFPELNYMCQNKLSHSGWLVRSGEDV